MPILAYHMVEPRFDLAITRVTPTQFRGQMEYLLKNGFAISPLCEYLRAQEPRTKSVALTFDDAYASVYQHAYPVLKEYGIRATLYVLSSYIGKLDDWDVNFGHIRFPHMTEQQILALHREGWEIGSHTACHWDLTRLDQQHLEEEVAGSKALLEKLIGAEVNAISYPFGNTDARVVACCKQAGYQTGVVMGRLHKQLEANYTIPRFGVYLYDFSAIFGKKVFGKNKKMFKLIQRGIDMCSDGTVLVKQGFGKPRKSA